MVKSARPYLPYRSIPSVRPHHLSQELKRAPSLVHDIHELVLRPNAANDHLVFPTRQAVVRFIAELVEGHSEDASLFVSHIIMQLCLDWWWRDFKDLDVRAGISELFTKAKGEAVEGRFRSRVRRHVPCWDNGEVGAGAAVVSNASCEGYVQSCDLLDNARRRLFGLKEWQEGGGDVDEAGEVDVYFLVESRQVDLIGFGEIVDALNACIEEDAVKIGVGAGHAMHEFIQVLAVTDIVRNSTGSVTVLADELIHSILSAAHCNDFGTLANELLCHAEADAGGGSHHENALIGERHGDFWLER